MSPRIGLCLESCPSHKAILQSDPLLVEGFQATTEGTTQCHSSDDKGQCSSSLTISRSQGISNATLIQVSQMAVPTLTVSLVAKYVYQPTRSSFLMSASRVSFFDRLNRMTEDALRGSGSNRVISAPTQFAQGQPKTPDPRRIQSTPSNMPSSKQWAQLTQRPISESVQQQPLEFFEWSTSMLGMPDLQQVSPEPSPSELLLARRWTRPSSWNRNKQQPMPDRKRSTPDPESPLDKVIDSFARKVRNSYSFEELSENWGDIDDMLQCARDAMQGRRPEESPTLERLIERLQDLNDSDSKNWPAPLNVKKRQA